MKHLQNVMLGKGQAGAVHHEGADENQSIFSNSGASSIDHVNLPNISQAELERYQKNQRLKACIKKYICDDYKAASQSENALHKAQNLLLSYADIVYTEEELLAMK